LTHAQQWVTRILGKKSLFFKGGFWAFLTKKMGEIKMSLIIIIKKKNVLYMLDKRIWLRCCNTY
jgi:hypothetical protein